MTAAYNKPTVFSGIKFFVDVKNAVSPLDIGPNFNSIRLFYPIFPMEINYRDIVMVCVGVGCLYLDAVIVSSISACTEHLVVNSVSIHQNSIQLIA